MKVRIQTYPPLGNVTRAKTATQSITIVLEVPQYFANQNWEVSLWYSIDEKEWQSSGLFALAADDGPVDLTGPESSHVSLHFQGHFHFNSLMQFTVKFRYGAEQPWLWAKQEYGLEDGYIISADATVASQNLDKVIPNLSPEWRVSTLPSQSPETNLWSLNTKIAPGKDNSSGFRNVDIGTPFAPFEKWFALVRNGVPWLAPRTGKSWFTLDKDAMICSFTNGKGRHLVFLAVSSVADVSSLFRSTDVNTISVHARNDSPMEQDVLVLVAEGHDVDRAMASVVYHARSLIWKYTHMNKLQLEMNGPGEVTPQWREYWYDGLGYCTWNSLGQNLSQDKILDALDKLKENNVNISNLIIDDNWQSVEATNENSPQPGWLDFEADASGFPGGLKHTVSQIKRRHPNIQHIFVWHALLGYWGGISPKGKIAQRYKTVQVHREDTGSSMTVVDHDDISRLYDDFYSFLIQAGVDGVKTDAQCMLDSLASASVRKELTDAYLDKWSIASLRHFSTNAISCMSQFPQALFHAFMPQIRPPLVVRNSDDYFPDVPSSHRWHVWTNAHNSIFTQYLNVVPDWDMFQTEHEFADFHAAARCLSGGPLYITDVPGRHNIELLKQCTAVTTLGKTAVLRPSVVGIAMDPYAEYNSGASLRIGSYHGSATGGISLLGVFQTSDTRSARIIPLNEFRGISQPGFYVVRAFTTGLASKPLHLTDTVTPAMLATPSLKGYEIYSVYELQCFDSKLWGVIKVASFGLIDKMTGSAAIEASSIERNSKISVVTKLKALGVLGVYISSLSGMTIDENFMVTIFGHPVPRHTVKKSEVADKVLEVDVETAWKELGLDSGWSNELEVVVNILRI